MKKFLLVMFPIFLIGQVAGKDFITKAYCILLGNQDVKQEYKELAQQALLDFGINPLNVPIKKMNPVGSIIALAPVSSFTAFGIWLDEKYLDSCLPEERIFQIYHEAAHYACRHHQRLLATGAGLTTLTLAGALYLSKKINEQRPENALLTSAAISVIALGSMYVGVLPAFVKQQEEQADREAAKKLKALNKTEILEVYKKKLETVKDKKSLWWPDKQEQEKLLNNFL